MAQHPFTFHLPGRLDEGWVRVEGGRLPQPAEVKFRLVGPTLRIIGLRFDNDQELSSSALRRVPLGELADELLTFLHDELDDLAWIEDQHREWLDRWGVTDQMQAKLIRNIDGYYATGIGSEDADMSNLVGMVEAGALHTELRGWLDRLQTDEESTERLHHRGPGAKPPTEGEYRAFAKTYLEELTSRARGAKSRTAKRLNMDRGTVYRWIKECQERKLLPYEGSQQS